MGLQLKQCKTTARTLASNPGDPRGLGSLGLLQSGSKHSCLVNTSQLGHYGYCCRVTRYPKHSGLKPPQYFAHSFASRASGKGRVPWFFLRGVSWGCRQTSAGAAASESLAGLDIQALTHVAGARRDISTDLSPLGFSWKAVWGSQNLTSPTASLPRETGGRCKAFCVLTLESREHHLIRTAL